MTTIGKLWTAGIAYVALAVGAGLSIMYNILDTMQVRGPLFDWADLVTAVAAPGIVLLMVEMFVSRIWSGQPWQIQIIRWLATLAIGGVAMRTSWTHGHDFMSSRGQTEDVATTWPLAIDLLAIMATALILASRLRGHGHALAMAKTEDGHVATMAKTEDGHVATPEPLATADAWLDDGHGHEAEDCVDMAGKALEDGAAMATQPLSEEYAATLAAELDAWEQGVDMATTQAGQEMAAEAEASTRTFANIVPPEAVKMIQAWDGMDMAGKALDDQVAERFGKSVRTARRWRSLVTGAPTSPA